MSPSPTARAREVVSVSVWYLSLSNLEIYAKESSDFSANLEREMPDFIRRRFTDCPMVFVIIIIYYFSITLVYKVAQYLTIVK